MPATLLLVPLDLGPTSEALVAYAARLARALGLQLHLFHTVSPVVPVAPEVPGFASGWLSPDVRAAALEGARAQLDALARGVEGLAVGTEVAEGEASDGIVARAGHGDVALVVMGTHGRRGLARAVLGSVAQRVLAHAPRPVVVCRPGTLDPALDAVA